MHTASTTPGSGTPAQQPDEWSDTLNGLKRELTAALERIRELTEENKRLKAGMTRLDAVARQGSHAATAQIAP